MPPISRRVNCGINIWKPMKQPSTEVNILAYYSIRPEMVSPIIVALIVRDALKSLKPKYPTLKNVWKDTCGQVAGPSGFTSPELPHRRLQSRKDQHWKFRNKPPYLVQSGKYSRCAKRIQLSIQSHQTHQQKSICSWGYTRLWKIRHPKRELQKFNSFYVNGKNKWNPWQRNRQTYLRKKRRELDEYKLDFFDWDDIWSLKSDILLEISFLCIKISKSLKKGSTSRPPPLWTRVPAPCRSAQYFCLSLDL